MLPGASLPWASPHHRGRRGGGAPQPKCCTKAWAGGHSPAGFPAAPAHGAVSRARSPGGGHLLGARALVCARVCVGFSCPCSTPPAEQQETSALKPCPSPTGASGAGQPWWECSPPGPPGGPVLPLGVVQPGDGLAAACVSRSCFTRCTEMALWCL